MPARPRKQVSLWNHTENQLLPGAARASSMGALLGTHWDSRDGSARGGQGNAIRWLCCASTPGPSHLVKDTEVWAPPHSHAHQGWNEAGPSRRLQMPTAVKNTVGWREVGGK